MHAEAGRALPARLGSRALTALLDLFVPAPQTGEHRALAYLKCKSKGAQVDLEGTSVLVNGSRGTVVAPPFLSRAFPEAAAGAAEGSSGGDAADDADLAARKAAAQAEKEAEEAAAAAARAEKLAAMQARLAAFQAAQAAAEGGEE